MNPLILNGTNLGTLFVLFVANFSEMLQYRPDPFYFACHGVTALVTFDFGTSAAFMPRSVTPTFQLFFNNFKNFTLNFLDTLKRPWNFTWNLNNVYSQFWQTLLLIINFIVYLKKIFSRVSSYTFYFSLPKQSTHIIQNISRNFTENFHKYAKYTDGFMKG